MKNRFILFLIFVTASPAVVRAQEAPLTPERVKQEAKGGSPGDYNEALSQKLFSSQRIDLIQAYFETDLGSVAFVEQMEKLPTSDFRDQVYLMILEEPWKSDPGPDGMGPISFLACPFSARVV